MDRVAAAVEHIVACHFGLDDNCFREGSRLRIATDAKHFLVYILKDVYGYRPKDIANRYGFSRRNVYMSAQIVREGIRLQPFYSSHYHDIMELLQEYEYFQE